jgi:hypothetical protein
MGYITMKMGPRLGEDGKRYLALFLMRLAYNVMHHMHIDIN